LRANRIPNYAVAVAATLLAGCAATPQVTVRSTYEDGEHLYQIKNQPLEVAKSTATEFCARMQRPASAVAPATDMELPKDEYWFECGRRPVRSRTADGTPLQAFQAKCSEQGKVIRTRPAADDPYMINIDCVSPEQIPER
jgi:hypothetical protein